MPQEVQESSITGSIQRQGRLEQAPLREGSRHLRPSLRALLGASVRSWTPSRKVPVQSLKDELMALKVLEDEIKILAGWGQRRLGLPRTVIAQYRCDLAV